MHVSDELRLCLSVCFRVCLSASVYVCMYVPTDTSNNNTHEHTHTHTHTHTHMCVCVCVCASAMLCASYRTPAFSYGGIWSPQNVASVTVVLRPCGICAETVREKEREAKRVSESE